MELVSRHHDTMMRLARIYVQSDAVAEEVVQDTWLAALRGLNSFRGEATFRTWLFSILVRRARTTGEREHRSVAVEDVQRAVDPKRFGAGGMWTSPPVRWDEDVESRLDASALGGVLRRGLGGLPDRQREVVLLTRRRRSQRRRGVLRPRHQRIEPARAPAPRAQSSA